MSTLAALAPYVAAEIECDNAERRRWRELEAGGWQIIDGGQDGTEADPGHWRITDATTGELVAEGSVAESFEDWECGSLGNCYHRDHITEDVLAEYDGPHDPGVPEGARRAVTEAVREHLADLENAMRAAGVTLPERLGA